MKLRAKRLWRDPKGVLRRKLGFLDPRPRQKQIYRKMRESRKIKNKLLVEKQRAERVEHKKRKKRAQQELYQLENELRAAKELSADEPTIGALPDGATGLQEHPAGTTDRRGSLGEV